MAETFTTQDLIAELLAEDPKITKRREGGVTHQEWAIAKGVSDTAGRNQLKKKMAAGKMTREWEMCNDGQRRFVYYRT